MWLAYTVTCTQQPTLTLNMLHFITKHSNYAHRQECVAIQPPRTKPKSDHSLQEKTVRTS